MHVEGFDFAFVTDIVPERTTEEAIHAVLPQARYANARGDPLNRYGAGPFYKFTKIPGTQYQLDVRF
jgi:hypothetical protein